MGKENQKKLLLILWMPLLLLCINTATAQSGKADKNGWQPLVTENGLKDWLVKIHHHEVGDNYKNTFSITGDTVKIRYDGYETFNERFGHLFFKNPFSWYHLSFEYKFSSPWRTDAPAYTKLNSGIMFHSQNPTTILKEQDWPISVEMQLLAGLDDGKPRPTGNMCSPGTHVVYKDALYIGHCINSTSKTYMPDEWVKAELIVYGDSLIIHKINGEEVMRYSGPQIGGAVVNRNDPNEKQDGKLLSSGYIGLQSEGQPIDFRGLKIMNFVGCTNKKCKNYQPYYLKHECNKCSIQKK